MPDNARKELYFEDFVQGIEYPAGSYDVSRDEIIDFARRWDPQPFHIDEAAANASIFGGLTACSAHIFSIFCITSQSFQNGIEPVAIAALGFDEMRMHKPVFAGDSLRCFSRIEELRESRSRPEAGIVVFASSLYNQRDEQVFTIKAASLMARRSREL